MKWPVRLIYKQNLIDCPLQNQYDKMDGYSSDATTVAHGGKRYKTRSSYPTYSLRAGDQVAIFGGVPCIVESVAGKDVTLFGFLYPVKASECLLLKPASQAASAATSASTPTATPTATPSATPTAAPSATPTAAFTTAFTTAYTEASDSDDEVYVE